MNSVAMAGDFCTSNLSTITALCLSRATTRIIRGADRKFSPGTYKKFRLVSAVKHVHSFDFLLFRDRHRVGLP